MDWSCCLKICIFTSWSTDFHLTLNLSESFPIGGGVSFIFKTFGMTFARRYDSQLIMRKHVLDCFTYSLLLNDIVVIGSWIIFIYEGFSVIYVYTIYMRTHGHIHGLDWYCLLLCCFCVFYKIIPVASIITRLNLSFLFHSIQTHLIIPTQLTQYLFDLKSQIQLEFVQCTMWYVNYYLI